MNCTLCNGLLETETDKALGVHMGFCPGPSSPKPTVEVPQAATAPAETAVLETAVEAQVESEVA